MDYLWHVGIDLGCSALSGSPSSAVAILDGDGKLTEAPRHFRRAAELASFLAPLPRDRTIVAVDAPRSVPDHARENYARRSCETALAAHSKEHVGSFSGVAALFMRWYEIETAYFADVRVIETYPRAVWAKLGVPHKPKDYKDKSKTVEIAREIERLTRVCCTGFTSHQVDAVLCAYTAWSYAKGQVEWHGNAGEGLMILPANEVTGRPGADAERIADSFRQFSSQTSRALTSDLRLAAEQSVH
jgi:predicted nuclease with RNAse H fold